MGKPLKPKKKRKAVRQATNDPEGEMDMPVMKTSELAAQHAERAKTMRFPHRSALTELGKNDEGKELFDDILKSMASPDNRQD